jgi:GTPase KRas protein
MRDQYLRTAQGMMMVYSITSRQSYEETQYEFFAPFVLLIHSAIRDQKLRVDDADHCCMVLLGNKSDLEEDRQVDSPSSSLSDC